MRKEEKSESNAPIEDDVQKLRVEHIIFGMYHRIHKF